MFSLVGIRNNAGVYQELLQLEDYLGHSPREAAVKNGDLCEITECQNQD